MYNLIIIISLIECTYDAKDEDHDKRRVEVQNVVLTSILITSAMNTRTTKNCQWIITINCRWLLTYKIIYISNN